MSQILIFDPNVRSSMLTEWCFSSCLNALRDLPESDIDLTDPDAPEVKNWSEAVRGGLYRPIKQPVTMRIDADVLTWFRRGGDGYQTRINEVLREHMERQGRYRR